ncbi:hypothetical protein BX616_009679 [Lobosporangium transversale]|nr:hypothetical protein BX616_009679 [Lobosporangium transversale]
MSVSPRKYRPILPRPDPTDVNDDKQLTIEQKLEILETWDRHVTNYNKELEGGSKFVPPKKIFCDNHNITPRVLKYILAKREELLNVSTGQTSKRYRLSTMTP